MSGGEEFDMLDAFAVADLYEKLSPPAKGCAWSVVWAIVLVLVVLSGLVVKFAGWAFF